MYEQIDGILACPDLSCVRSGNFRNVFGTSTWPLCTSTWALCSPTEAPCTSTWASCASPGPLRAAQEAPGADFRAILERSGQQKARKIQ